MDEQVRNVIGLVVLGILGGVGTYLSRRQLRKAGIGADQGEIVSNLRDAVAGWREKYDLEAEGRRAADRKLAETIAEQLIERSRASECRSDLDDARDTIRDLREQFDRRERRRKARPPAEPTT